MASGDKRVVKRSQDPLIGIFRGVAETAARAGGGLFDRLANRGGGGSSNGDDD